MLSILPLLILVVVTGVTAYLAGIGLRMASRGEASIALKPRLLAAALGAAVLMFPLLALGAAEADPLVLLLQASFGASLASLALLDRMTAWAPDMLTAPAVILGSASGATFGHWDMGVLAAILAGVSLFGTVQILWALFARTAFHIPPPPDLYGLLLPVLLFSFSIATVVSYGAFALVLLLYRSSSSVRHVFSVEESMQQASRDLGISAKEGEFVPLLAVICPVLLGVSLLSQTASLW